MKKLILIVSTILLFASCSSENYSAGERIGLVTQFSRSGIFYKSWEGHLNLTQTGMNSSVPFDFSIDNDNEPPGLVSVLDSAANYGWKVKLTYHETFNKNWFKNRGETDHFVTSCVVLDRKPLSLFSGDSTHRQGKVIDTIYVIIDKSK